MRYKCIPKLRNALAEAKNSIAYLYSIEGFGIIRLCLLGILLSGLLVFRLYALRYVVDGMEAEVFLDMSWIKMSASMYLLICVLLSSLLLAYYNAKIERWYWVIKEGEISRKVKNHIIEEYRKFNLNRHIDPSCNDENMLMLNNAPTSILEIYRNVYIIANQVFVFVALLALFGTYSWVLSLSVFFFTIPMACIEYSNGRRFVRLVNDTAEVRRKENLQFMDIISLNMFRENRIHDGFSLLKRLWLREKTCLLEKEKSRAKRHTKGIVQAETVFQVFSVIVLLVIAKEVLNSHYTIGVYVAVSASMIQVNQNLKTIMQALTGLDQHISLVGPFLRRRTADEDGIEVDEITSDYREIQISAITFGYSNDLIFKDANLALKSRKLNIVRGANGKGKTTLLDLITGNLVSPTMRVSIDGVSVPSIPVSDISYLPQESARYTASLKDNIIMENQYHDYRLKQIIEVLNLGNLSEHFSSDAILGVGFKDSFCPSFGQWRKIGLARALYKEAKIYVFDEPEIGLDESTIEKLYELLYSMTKTKILVIATHGRFCGKIDEYYDV